MVANLEKSASILARLYRKNTRSPASSRSLSHFSPSFVLSLVLFPVTASSPVSAFSSFSSNNFATIAPFHGSNRNAADSIFSVRRQSTGKDDVGGDKNGNEFETDDSMEDLSSESRNVFDEITRDFLTNNDNSRLSEQKDQSDFPSTFPPPPMNPFASGLTKSRSKMLNVNSNGSLYTDDELMKVLSTHNQLSDQILDDGDVVNSTPASNGDAMASLHELVLQSIGETDNVNGNSHPLSPDSTDNNNPESTFMNGITPQQKQNIQNVRAIASDVDGTLLTSRQTLHPRTRNALLRALSLHHNHENNFVFFPATGKSRKGALDSIGIEIGSIIANGNVPGVYLQGLYCIDGSGNVIFEKKLSHDAIVATEKLVEEYNLSIVAYDGDNLYTTDQTEIVIHLHEHYGEPMPRLLINCSENGTKTNLAQHPPGMHKILILDDDTERLANIIRPQLEKLAAESGACVTQAIPTMLELLPAGCSKALGVSKVCDALGIDMGKELLALGDAENDSEMLRNAGVGVAMGNGCPKAKEAADFILEDTNNDGGAGLAMELFGFGNY